MNRLDLVLAFVAALCLAAYIAVLLWKVPSPPLIVISLIGILMAMFDFAQTYRRRRGPDAAPRQQRSDGGT